MKAFAFGFLLAGLLFPASSPLFSQTDPPLTTPHFELYKADEFSKRPMGVLGLPIGTFAVIEGTEHHTSMFWGSDDFVVERINGKKVKRDVRIMTDWPSQLPDKRISGKRYVLHGYERGVRWEGLPDGLPRGEPSGWTQGGFIRDPSGWTLGGRIFTVTSVEKVDGVTVADARPLDPKIPLAEPDFSAKPDNARPVGLLGLPLGTFAIIQVHSTKRFPPTVNTLMVSPFDIDTVNGKPLDSQRVLSIPGVATTKDGERVTLHGFEAGEWGGGPSLPHSEDPTDGREIQQWFQFYPKFNLTTPVKSGG